MEEENIKVHDLDLELKEPSSVSTSKVHKIFVYFSKIKNKFLDDIKRKKNERLTLMLIPHNEKKIKNYIISNLTLTIFVVILSVVILGSSIVIINHNSTVQKVNKMKVSQKEDKLQFRKIKSEIRKISKSFSKVRSNLNELYALSNGKKKSLFAQGGPLNLIKDKELETENSIPLEIYMLNRILNDIKISEIPIQQVYKFVSKRKRIINNTPTLWPVKGYIINPFGSIRSSQDLTLKYNNGVDIASILGSKVLSTASGVIISIKRDSKWGWTIVIRHRYGYETLYKGLERISVSSNEKVVKGDVIGYLGHPKNSLESILHYEIKVGVEAQNPTPYLNIINQ